MYSLKFKETLKQDETQYWRALRKECQPQSQILVTRGDWSGRYKTGGEPTLLEGLRKCASKELGVIPTSPFKKSSSSSSTTSCTKTEITNKIASSSLKCFQEFLSSGMCYFWRKKKWRKKNLHFEGFLWCTLLCYKPLTQLLMTHCEHLFKIWFFFKTDFKFKEDR